MRNFGVTTVLAACVIAATTGAASAAPRSADLSGTLTVIERIDHTTDNERIQHVARVRWQMPGSLYESDRRMFSNAIASVLEYHGRTDLFQGEDGQPDCTIRAFTGFVPPEDGLPTGTTQLQVQAQPLDKLRKRARIDIRLPDMWAPTVSTTWAYCHDMTPREERLSLVASPRAGVDAGARALIGIGAARPAGTSQSLASPIEIMSTPTITMRYRAKRWRARGSRLMKYELWDGTPVTYQVKWNLVARHPTRSCSKIPVRSVRGRTITATRRIIRRAGYRPGKVFRVTQSRVARGRVVGTSASTSLPCGSRVDLHVRR